MRIFFAPVAILLIGALALSSAMPVSSANLMRLHNNPDVPEYDVVVCGRC